MENTECVLPTSQECPGCGLVHRVEDFNDGQCICGRKYTWKTVGSVGAETTDSGHDYISWRI